MGINFAIKHKEIIYLVGNINPELNDIDLTPMDFGIVFQNDSFVVGSYDLNPVDYILEDNPQWFEIPENNLPDKGNIVNYIVNPWFKRCCELNLIKEANAQKAFRHILVYKNKIFQLLKSLFVVEVNHYAAFGQEEQVIFSDLLSINDSVNIEDFIYSLMIKISHSYNKYTNRYIVYNTFNHTYNIYKVNSI